MMSRLFLCLWLTVSPAFGSWEHDASAECYYHYDQTPGLCDATNNCFDENDDWTVCAQVNADTLAGDEVTLVGKYSLGNSNARQFLVRIEANGDPSELQIFMNSGSRDTTAAVFNSGTWYSVCVVNNGAATTGQTWAFDISDSPPTTVVDGDSYNAQDDAEQDSAISIGAWDTDDASVTCGNDMLDGRIANVAYFAEEFDKQASLDYATCPHRVVAQRAANIKWFLPIQVGDTTDSPDYSGNAANFTSFGIDAGDFGANPPVCP